MKTKETKPSGKRRQLGISISLVMASWLLLITLNTLQASSQAQPSILSPGFGYGFNVAAWDTNLLQSMGFNWMKVFNGPGSRQSVNILLRVEATSADLGNLSNFRNRLYQLAQDQKGFVEAYEIGNEPNLDASYGWTAAPNAADYATLLCEAHAQIKAADPSAIVVSAGLAPTGRVSGNWNGHPGHNGGFQDEREFFKEFVAAGGAGCLDAVGYHPYGFSADYDASPDISSADSTQNCGNGFCFRGVEKIYELMQLLGMSDKKVWATEFGWIVRPPQLCLDDKSWEGRLWQIVSEEKQAQNLAGAFQYATANWPWMEAMFIFNLNFNTTAGLALCEQMNYYGVQGRPAESALRDMPKVNDPPVAELVLTPLSLAQMIATSQQPYTWTAPVKLSNIGSLSFTYTMTARSGTLAATLDSSGGTVPPAGQAETWVTIRSISRPTGTYTASLLISATAGTVGVPQTIPITLHIVDAIHPAFLPIVMDPD